MTFWVIFGIVSGFLLLILLLPFGVSVKFKDEFELKIHIFGVNIYSVLPKKKAETEQKKHTDTPDLKEEKNKDSKLFQKLKAKKGFSSAVKEIFSFIYDCLSHIKNFLRHIKIKRLTLDITVASDDAAKTAIEYGAVCSAVYPTLALLDTCPNIRLKQINVKSDFSSQKADFGFSLKAYFQLLFILIAAFKIFKEYKKFVARNEL